MFLRNPFNVLRERIFQERSRSSLWTFMVLIIFLATSISTGTSTTFPVTIKPGDTFMYKVLEDHILASVNDTTYLNDTYLSTSTDKVLIKVLNVQNISDDQGIWGLNTIVNQSETAITSNNKTTETFSYVNGWLDSYHFGLFSILYIFDVMTRAPQLYKFSAINPRIQAAQDGLPVFVTTNSSYYEAIMAANPPPDNQSQGTNPPPGVGSMPPYSLSYTYEKEQGIYIMNHTMRIENNGTLSDNITKWSLRLDFEFFLDTIFSKSIVNELKIVVFWDVEVGNATQQFEWKLHVTLEPSTIDITAEKVNDSKTSTMAMPIFILVISLGIFAVKEHRKRRFIPVKEGTNN